MAIDCRFANQTENRSRSLRRSFSLASRPPDEELDEMLSRLNRIRAEHWFAAGNGLAALAIGLAAFGLRAARTPWVELPAALTMVLLAASAVALALRMPWA